MKLATAVWWAVVFTIGNFLYQIITGQGLWGIAIERSYFQSAAVLTIYIFGVLRGA